MAILMLFARHLRKNISMNSIPSNKDSGCRNNESDPFCQADICRYSSRYFADFRPSVHQKQILANIGKTTPPDFGVGDDFLNLDAWIFVLVFDRSGSGGVSLK